MILSCTIERDNLSYTEESLDFGVWVCHNPESKHHGEICVEECYIPSSPHNFCWLLNEDDCKNSKKLEWQEKNCQLINN